MQGCTSTHTSSLALRFVDFPLIQLYKEHISRRSYLLRGQDDEKSRFPSITKQQLQVCATSHSVRGILHSKSYQSLWPGGRTLHIWKNTESLSLKRKKFEMRETEPRAKFSDRSNTLQTYTRSSFCWKLQFISKAHSFPWLPLSLISGENCLGFDTWGESGHLHQWG